MQSWVKYRPARGLVEPGVPARDLTRDEWERLPAGLRAALLDQGVYEIVDPPEPEPVDLMEDDDDGTR